MGWNYRCEVSELLGKVLIDIFVDGHDQIIFTTSDGEKFKMYHNQNCCEKVYIESFIGEVSDLIGSPILIAEEVSSDDDCGPQDEWDVSYTWTFYKFATINGYVDIRWYGSSNGYYSESVDFERIA